MNEIEINLNKKYSYGDYIFAISIAKETEKAIGLEFKLYEEAPLIQTALKLGILNKLRKIKKRENYYVYEYLFWLPKSQIKISGEKITVPFWLVKQLPPDMVVALKKKNVKKE